MKIPQPSDMPESIKHLPRDERGFPIPWFVATRPDTGERDLRFSGQEQRWLGWRNNLCWVCGQPLEEVGVFVTGPVGIANGVSGDWCSHRQCAQFSAIWCPAINGGMARRRTNDQPETVRTSGGTEDLVPAVGLAHVALTNIGWVNVDSVVFDRRWAPTGGSPFCWVKAERVDWWQAGEYIKTQAGYITQFHPSRMRKKNRR